MAITTDFSELKYVNVSERELKKDKISLRLSDNKSVGFSKVLEKRCELFIESSEVFDDAIAYSLGVYTSVIFVDLRGEIRQSTYEGSVGRNLSVDGVKQGDAIVLRPTLSELEIDKIVGEDLTLDLTYSLSAVLFESDDITALTDLSGGYSRRESVRYISLAKAERIELSFEENLATDENAAFALSAKSEANDISAVAKEGVVDIKGSVTAEITYLKDGDERNVGRATKTFPIAESLEIEAAAEGDRVLLFPSSKITFVELLEDENSFDVRCDFVFYVVLLKEAESEVITEAFSKTHELLPSVEITEFDRYDGMLKTSASDSVAYSVEDFDKVVATLSGAAEIVNLKIEKSSVVVDVLAKISGIIDIDGSYVAREFDVPVCVTVPTDEKERLYIPSAYVSAKDIAAKGDGVVVSAKVDVELLSFSEDTLPIITRLETGEEKPSDYPAIIVYIAKGGESEIDLAKKVNLSPDEIAEQFPAKYPLAEGERIVLYRRRLA